MAVESVLERRMRNELRKQMQCRVLWPSKKLGMVRKGQAWTKTNDIKVAERRAKAEEKNKQ